MTGLEILGVVTVSVAGSALLGALLVWLWRDIVRLTKG